MECEMNFRIAGISPDCFSSFFSLNDAELAANGAQRVFADDASGYPCRVSLTHAAPGEELLLISHSHQTARSPYQASGPIFVRKAAAVACEVLNNVPEPVRVRLLSVHAYDADDMIVEADVVDGVEVESLIERFFEREDVVYLHIHYARRGCYACRVDRV
jgi:hypothetical protein